MGFHDEEVFDDDNFLRIAANDKVQFNILSDEPNKRITHWIEKKPFPCDGKGCSKCLEGNKPRKSWTTKVFDRKSGKVKEFEYGVSIANQIKNIASMLIENQGSIHDVDLRITREGSTMMDTEYLVIHVPKAPLPEGVGKVTTEPPF
jgi:hypothetical protein